MCCNRSSPPKRAAGEQQIFVQSFGEGLQQEQPPEEGCGGLVALIAFTVPLTLQQEQPPEEGCGRWTINVVVLVGFRCNRSSPPKRAAGNDTQITFRF